MVNDPTKDVMHGVDGDLAKTFDVEEAEAELARVLGQVVPERAAEKFADFEENLMRGLEHLLISLTPKSRESEEGYARVYIDARLLNPDAFYSIDIQVSKRGEVWFGLSNEADNDKIYFEPGYEFHGLIVCQNREMEKVMVRSRWGLRKKQMYKETGRPSYHLSITIPHRNRDYYLNKGKSAESIEEAAEIMREMYATLIEKNIRGEIPERLLKGFEYMIDILNDLPGTLCRIYEVKKERAEEALVRL